MMRFTVIIGVVFIILFSVTTVSLAGCLFNRKVNKEVEQMFADNYQADKEIFSERDLVGLPEPVQNWLRTSGVVGKEKISAVRLKQEGKMRIKPDGKWTPAKAEQYFVTENPGFIWKVKVKMMPFVGFVGRDKYIDGQGHMLIKLLSLINVADDRGPEIDQGTLLRYLGEIIWFPAAAVSDYISWEEIDSQSAKATMSYGEVTASAVFEFNEQGDPIKFRCKRYYAAPEGPRLEDYVARVSGYQEFEGVRIPSQGEAVWKLDTGEYSYYQFKITEVEFNKPQVY